MFSSHLGEFAALITAVCWTFTALFFEQAVKQIGSLNVNILRLFFAIFLLSTFSIFYRNQCLPLDASSFNWIWLSISGLVGFAFGDLCLFQAFLIIGARTSLLIMSLVPVITAFFSWIILGEQMTLLQIFAMTLTISGILTVVLKRKYKSKSKYSNPFSLNYSFKGILFALGGAFGQAIGLILSKYGMKDYDAFASTQIRVIAGFLSFSLIFFFINKWKSVFKSFTNTKAMIFTGIGAIFGPFLGVSFSLISVKYTTTGIASTIMAIVPVLIIPPSILIFKEKISIKDVVGAVIAICGVAIFFR